MTAPRFMEDGPITRIQVAWPANKAVSLGDYIYKKGDGTYGLASEIADTGTLAGNQADLAEAFVGIAGAHHGANDPADPTFPVMTDVEAEYDVMTATTFQVGNYVGGAENVGGTALQNQAVEKVAGTLSIGIVTQAYTANTTRVRARFLSRVMPHTLPPLA